MYQRLAKWISVIVLIICCHPAALADIPVLQRGYTPDVAGANLNETLLTPANVSASTFGRLFSLPVDGSIYAQPLYVPNLNINGGTHNVVFVATMKNIVYAFDADVLGPPLWEVNYSNTITGATPVPITTFNGTNTSNIPGPVGIESTPVIDAGSNTLYFVTNTLESGNVVFRLHAVDITSGAEKFGGPTVINASISFGGNTLNFIPGDQNQRASLTLANGQVIVAFASHEDAFLYYGWVMSYNAATLAQTGVFNPAPSNYGGGVWQCGRPPVVDSAGNVYLYTGNGFSISNQVTADGTNNFAESVLKLDPVTLNVIDYFTPANFQFLDANDLDLSSSGPTLIPGSNVLIGGGKTGNLYLLNTQNLGQMQTNDSGALQNAPASLGEIRGGAVIWSRSTAAGGPLVYNWGVRDVLKAFSYNPQTSNISTNTVSTFWGGPLLYPGGTLAVSANGDQNGIVWAVVNSQGNADISVTPGVLRALNGADLTQELWNTTMIPTRDDFGLWTKYVPPLVVNGKVFMATQSNQLVVYGLLPTSGAVTVTAWPPLKTAMGDAENYLVSALSASGAEVTASWTVTGLPTGASGQFQIDTHGRNLLHLTMDGTTPPGSYRLNLTANVSGSQTTQSVLLNVVSATTATAVSATADSEISPNPAEAAIDQNIFTFWKSLDTPSTAAYQHSIKLDLGGIQPVTGLLYLPRHDGCVDGTALQYEVYLSQDNINWTTQTAGGSFDYGGAWRSFACDNQTFPQSQKISFPATNARYVLLNLLSPVIDATLSASAAEVWAYLANDNQPQVSLTSSAINIAPAQAVTFTANVTGANPGGTVQFYLNGVAYQTPVALTNGSASLTTTGLNTTGAQIITASYSGDASNPPMTSSVFNLNIIIPNPITLSADAYTIAAGQSITLTATVSGTNPSGAVQFYLNGAPFQSPVALSNGIAVLTTTGLNQAGADAITASYSGDSINPASSSTVLGLNVLNPTSITLLFSPDFIIAGQSFTVSATVAGANPSGTVQFYLNGIAFQMPVPLSSGVAVLTVSGLNDPGADVITASYSGDSTNAAATSSVLNLNILNSSSMTLSASADTISAGQSLTLSASVSGANPTGTVQFYLNGSAYLTPVPLVDGIASLTTNDPSLTGTETITASYSGDGNNAPNTSLTPLTETVTPATQTVPALPGFFQILMALCLYGTGMWIKRKTR